MVFVYIYSSLHDMVQDTLCPKGDSDEYNINCLHRKCEKCGVSNLKFHTQETDESTSEKVTWWTFEYVPNEYGEKKLTYYVKKITAPYELVACIKKSLIDYPYHAFTSTWQRKQWQNLIRNLPETYVALECDFSENLACTMQEEVQSLHWATKQVAIHSMTSTVAAKYQCRQRDSTSCKRALDGV